MRTRPIVSFVSLVLAWIGVCLTGSPLGICRAETLLKLKQGISIDRQLHSIPPGPADTIHRDDIRLIKSMGFQFVKLIFNPAVLKLEGDLDASHLWYFDRTVQLVVDEQMPVVVCIHPEPEFKRAVLGNAEEFARFLGFMDALSRHMARRWISSQLAFQLMTEPFGSSPNVADWNHWDRLQRRLWKTIRGNLRQHTLILSGDRVGSIDGLFDIAPVDDDNVLYGFSFYDPQVFTQQGIGTKSDDMFYLKNLPYPSGPGTLAAMPTILASVPRPWKADITRRIEQYAGEQWNETKLAARIGRLAEWRKLHGKRPKLWCSEFGCNQAAAPADRYRYLADVRRLLDNQGIGWAYWSYNETFSVLTSDRTPNGPAKAQSPDKALLRILLSTGA